mgnify:CR=1 FL=1
MQEIRDPICWSPPWGPLRNRCSFRPVASETILPVVPAAPEKSPAMMAFTRMAARLEGEAVPLPDRF